MRKLNGALESLSIATSNPLSCGQLIVPAKYLSAISSILGVLPELTISFLISGISEGTR